MDTTTTSATPNVISGKVIVKETGAGIPDLLVVLQDVDSGLTTSGYSNATSNSGELGDRIGSVLTGSDGTWSLSYQDSEFGIEDPTEKRPDLLLTILAPEDADRTEPPIVLHSSKVLRVNSGRNEAYLVRINEAKLTEAQIVLPADSKEKSSSNSKVQAYREKRSSMFVLKQGMKQVNNDFDSAESYQKQELKNTIKKHLLPDAKTHQDLYNFVTEEKNTKDVQQNVFSSGVAKITEQIGFQPEVSGTGIAKTAAQTIDDLDIGRGIKMHFFLTEVEKEGLDEYKIEIDAQNYYYKLPESKIKEIMAKREASDGISTILFSQNPISKYCLEKSAQQKCAEYNLELPGGNTETEESNGETTPVVLTDITNEDIPKYLNKVLSGQMPGLNGQTNYASQRPNAASVQNNINSFALQKGPADTTAFYDFHSLQIAFDHVWQQLLDETLVNLAEQIHTEQENNGTKGWIAGIPNNPAAVPGLSNVLTAVQQSVNTTRKEELPPSLVAAFDISYLEYMSLNSDHKIKLHQIADKINSFENSLVDSTDNAIQIAEKTTKIALLRDQGERIIDHARVNKTLSTNAMLKELQERLLSKYAFTVFAADKDHLSVNFGLMNTYRQEWEPISYQAGKLVRTMPLAPKEERKYSVKITQNSKTSKKQAQKNNSSISSEKNSTSRAESEIMAKAQEKSHFDAGASFDGWGFHAEAHFGKDSEKESSQTKKDFRESVLKAAQEFKEERSLEIDTEESYGSEYNESGTIVNPNDELSVTYLFYELQRRYRVSEKLHRIAPVVLVAQPVPAPHQITEAWVVAHDWILNRVLLDDSFRPTVQMIGTKSVGDDYAIRELRKNLRQQRSLVNSLQIEQSKLNRVADNKYNSMTRLIGDRINVEHSDRYEHWWNDDHRTDPEMAKAKEMAAADQHKYAVEQAQQMAISLQNETMALRQMTSEYNSVMRDHLDKITQVRRLLTHIRENILYYMQAIWMMEPPDQRYMRLYKAEVPVFEAERECVIQGTPVEDMLGHFRTDGKQKHVGWMRGNLVINENGTTTQKKQLIEVADISNLLGFKGNYMIFPMKEHNALTSLMAAPYIDEAFGAMDPDELGSINLTEFAKYICCLHDENPAEYERLKPVLQTWYEKLISDPLRNGDEVIVPTGSLFIEMLPSDKSLLEDFKLKHREWDVYKVQAEVRKMELENIRYAARLLNDNMEDPQVEKRIVVEGNGPVTTMV